MLTSKRSAECEWYSRSNIFFLNLKFNPKIEEMWKYKIKQRIQKIKMNSKSWERENRWRNWVNQKRLVTAASCDISISHKLALYEHSCTCFAPMMPNPTSKMSTTRIVCRAKNASNYTSKQTKYFRTKTNTNATELQAADRYFSQFLADENHPNNIFFSSLSSFCSCRFFPLFISQSLSFVRFFSNLPVHYFQAIDWKVHTLTHTHTHIKGAHGCGSEEVN